MAMLINHNLFAKDVANLYNNTVSSFNQSLSKLSSGLRTSVTDFHDASGMEIAQQMASKINGYSKAMAGGQDGISLLQTAEGALTEVDSMLQRMRELANQAASDTLTGQDRAYIQAEIDQLRSEIDRIGNTTRFNNKRLLNGNAAALWSAIPKETQAIIRGGLKSVDQFGQKTKAEGNFDIKLLAAPPGEAEVQKSSVFKVKSENAGMKVQIDDNVDNIVSKITVENPYGDVAYNVSSADPTTKIDNYSVASYVHDPASVLADPTRIFTPNRPAAAGSARNRNEENTYTYDLAFEVTDKNFTAPNVSSSVTFKVTGFQSDMAGNSWEIDTSVTVQTRVSDGKLNSPVNVSGGGLVYNSNTIQFVGGLEWGSAEIEHMTVGDKFLINTGVLNMPNGDGNTKLEVSVNTPANSPASNAQTHQFMIGDSQMKANGSVTLKFMTLDTETGEFSKNSVTLDLSDKFTTGSASATNLKTAKSIASTRPLEIGEPATGSVKLRDVDKFYEDDKFLLDEPQTITITQGDGKTANITLYADDTLDDVAKKINDAIADDLGQKKYVNDDSKFATFVDEASANTSEAVAGTLLIRSAVSGSRGTLRFSGSEEIIKALGLNTIQEATESVFTAEVTDAHSGEHIASATVTGNILNGVLNKNVDVEFDAMAGVTRTWDAESNSYQYSAAEYKSTVHLADNTLTLQMGIGSNQDMFLSIGDMRSQALGINDVLVTDRESAANALSIIDNAIDIVSTQRAKLGAYANRIAYNLDNMRIAEQNITSAGSNIKDTDIAKEMMNFVRQQIKLNAGSSMLAQANQTQETILTLLRQ